MMMQLSTLRYSAVKGHASIGVNLLILPKIETTVYSTLGLALRTNAAASVLGLTSITFVSDERDVKILNSVQDRFEVNITEMPAEIDVSSYCEYLPLWPGTSNDIYFVKYFTAHRNNVVIFAHLDEVVYKFYQSNRLRSEKAFETIHLLMLIFAVLLEYAVTAENMPLRIMINVHVR